MLGGLAQVHLQSGRVKEKDSLIEKVIRKRYEYIGSKTSAYAHLRGDNYAEIITDLVGVKLIIGKDTEASIMSSVIKCTM